MFFMLTAESIKPSSANVNLHVLVLLAAPSGLQLSRLTTSNPAAAIASFEYRVKLSIVTRSVLNTLKKALTHLDSLFPQKASCGA